MSILRAKALLLSVQHVQELKKYCQGPKITAEFLVSTSYTIKMLCQHGSTICSAEEVK